MKPHFLLSVANQIAGVYVILFHFSWRGLVLACVCHAIVECLGVTICYHRALAHRALRLWKPLEYLLALIGSFAFHGSPLQWVTIHRQHHRFSDHDGDPHDARRGLAYSHLLWFNRNFFPCCTEEKQRQYSKDLLDQRFYRLFGLAFAPFGLAVGYLLYRWFGLVDGLLWGGLVRHLIGCHFTFSINSITHAFGFRAYRRDDLSTNCSWLAIPTFGESWHNNHHAFPASARFGLRWWQLDLGWQVIRLLEALGLAWDVKQPSEEEIEIGSGPRTIGELIGVARPAYEGYQRDDR